MEEEKVVVEAVVTETEPTVVDGVLYTKLKSGRSVAIREVSALEEVMAYQLVSESVDPKNPNSVGVGFMHRATMILLSVVQYNGEQFELPAKLAEVYPLLRKFPVADWNEVERLYSDLNEKDLTPGK